MLSPNGFRSGSNVSLPRQQSGNGKPARARTHRVESRPLDAFRTNTTLLLVAGFIILNSGFMLLRVPPVGPGVPIGEMWLAVMLATAFLDIRFSEGFAAWAPLHLLSAWWLLGLCHLLNDLPLYGFWAIRDAAHWMETSYLWIGFVLASRPSFYPKFERWLRRVFSIVLYYILTYPFRVTLSGFSPKIQSVSGYNAPLLFSYLNISSGVITGFFRILLERHGSAERASWKILVGSLALVMVIVLLQMRTAYLQLLLAICLLMICRARRLGRLTLVVVVGISIVAILLNLNLDLTGRTGAKFSLDFLFNHVRAIWGGGDYSVRSAAEGVSLRLGWWKHLIDEVNSSASTALFGLGFGMPLTSFHGPTGDVAREAHDSAISVYARLGAVGLLLFIGIQARIYIAGFKLIFTLRSLGKWRVLATIATTLCFLAMCLTFSLGEGGMEVSYVAIPYYFLSGVLLAINRRIRLELRAGPGGF